MYYKSDHKQVLCFQRAPYRNCTVQVLCFERAPQQQLQFEGTLLSKGSLAATEMCKYSALKGPPNSHYNM